MSESSLTIGVLGGMGPMATIDLLQRIIRLTPALDDVDHIRTLVDNNPKVPSRINHLINRQGENPAPVLVSMAESLESMGADLHKDALPIPRIFMQKRLSQPFVSGF